MKFSYIWLQSYFNKKLPEPEKLAGLLTMHSFETEALDGRVLDVDVLPNRVPDCSSHIGIAREIASILGYKLQVTGYELQKDSKLHTRDYISIEVKDKKKCPRYVGLLVRGVKIGSSPKWLQERLNEVGQKSINNIVDIANYVMLETGQPLHAFDMDKIGGKKIIVREATGGETIETLDNKKISLPVASLVVADDKEPLVVAGIKGGKKAEIKKNTKDIVIEAAIFHGPSIRQASKATKLQTDASYRFEHGVPFSLPETAIWRVAALVQKIAGGSVAESFIDISTGRPRKNPIIFSKEDVSNVLGGSVETNKIEKILKSLNFSFKKDGDNYLVTSPLERTDINIKEDIIEEIIRMHGYENIKSEIPKETAMKPEVDENYVYSNWVRTILSELGFTEVYNYSFAKLGKVRIKNPQSSEKRYLRESLAPGLKQSVDVNLKNFVTVKLFEIGKTFAGKRNEMSHVAVAIGRKKGKGKGDIEAELRGVADSLFIKDADDYIKNDVFEISLNKIIEEAKNSEIVPSEPLGFTTEDVGYRPFSKFPAVLRDISLFVLPDTRIEEVTDIIENTAGELLIDSDLLDEYTPPGGERKSFTFHLIFQSFNKTLTDKEVNQTMDKIISALEENKTWQVRKK